MTQNSSGKFDALPMDRVGFGSAAGALSEALARLRFERASVQTGETLLTRTTDLIADICGRLIDYFRANRRGDC